MGQITEYALGKDIVSEREFNPETMRLEGIVSYTDDYFLQEHAYSYDDFGNLASRMDNKRGMEESFLYDDMNRLTTITTNGVVSRMEYDDYGRILSKQTNGMTVFSDAQYNTYDTHGMLKPHAISGASVAIDPFPNGSQSMTYTMFDKVKTITQDNRMLSYEYGYDHQRIKMLETVDGTIVAEKHYFGNCEIVHKNADYPYTYLSGPLGTFAVVRSTTSADHVSFIFKDHLGSWTTISDYDGAIEQELSFDAWGNLRDPETWSGEFTETPLLDRGYTGHEHLYNFGLINMNGRMYDPVMSSFLSVDNYVCEPDFSQAFNRYSYCLNNPLKYTDPDGEFPWIAMAIGAGIGVLTNGIDNVINDKPFFEGALKAAVFGGVQGVVSFGIGQAAMGMATIGDRVAFQALAHGTLGGASNALTGGDIGSGFVSGVAGSLVASGMGSITQDAGKWGQALGTVGGGALAGGVSSYLSGGNFLDGLRNGAISAGLNHAVHMGLFGKGVAIAAITGRTRHLFGPDAISVSVGQNTTAGIDESVSTGKIRILVGPEKGSYPLSDFGMGVGAVSVGVGLEGMEFYSSSAVVYKSDFAGPRFYGGYSVSCGFISLGGGLMYSPHANSNDFTIGFGPTIGIDALPLGFNIELNYGASSVGNWRNIGEELHKAFKIKK